MPISRRTLLTAAAAAPLASLLPRSAFAAYPDKPIRLIVPFAAGGNADLVARIVAEGMSPSLGQTIVVETRAGAGGSLGAAVGGGRAARRLHAADRLERPADRQSVRAGQAQLRSAQGLRRRSGSPISRRIPSCCTNSVPAKTVAELVALSKTAADHARHLRRRQRVAPDAGALQCRDRRQPRRTCPIAAAARSFLMCWPAPSPAQ